MMRDRIKRFLAWRPGPVVYLTAMVIALLLLLLPLLRMAQYAVPWYDDYTYGGFARMAMRKGVNIVNACKGVRECIHISWYAWQGTYGSILFLVLTPAIWGEGWYWLGPVSLLLLLVTSVCMLADTMAVRILGTDHVHGLGIGTVTAMLALELLHTAQEGIYWYNGGVHYVGMHALLLFMAAFCIHICYAERTGAAVGCTAAALVLAALTAGANFVTALQGALVLLTICALLGWKRKHRLPFLLLITIAYGIGFYLNVSAPGNAKRAANYVGWGMSPVKAVLYSFVQGGRLAWAFTGWMTLAILLFLLPIVPRVVHQTHFAFRFPGIVTAWSVCLYATGFTPSLYSLGHPGLDRTLNAVKLTWQLLLVGNLIYWYGYAVRVQRGKRSETAAQETGGRMFGWWYYLLAAGAVCIAFMAEPNPEGSFSSYGAYYEIHTGLAYNFHQEYLERVEQLQGEADPVVLTPYHWTPWLICMGDLSEDPEEESNRALADWYDKDAVYVLPEE